MPLRTAALRPVIDAVAQAKQLPSFSYRGVVYSPGVLLEALAATESSGDERARRYEPHQDRAGRADQASDADRPDVDDGVFEDDASYGLFQVMGYNLRRLVGAQPGARMRFDWAYDPVVNMAMGVAILKDELRRLYLANPTMPESEMVVRALCRYNGGPTGDAIVDGDLRRREYVDKVAARCAAVRRDRE